MNDHTITNLNGKEISKNSPVIHLIGDLDELNSHLGLVKARIQEESDKIFLEKVQQNLAKMMAYLSDQKNKKYFFTENETAALEIEINKLKEKLPKQADFVIPGKSETDALIHIARTVARRAERSFVCASETAHLNPHCASFLNRLSSHLFVLALKENKNL